jgi:hypothetical protein
MNAAQVHLLFNHVPVLGSLFCLLLLVGGLLKKSDGAVRAGLAGLVLAALGTLPAFFSGEGAEHLVRPQPGVSTLVMAEHEDAAWFGFLAMEALGVLALAGLVVGRGGRPLPRGLLLAASLGSVFVFAVMARVAHLGGQVHHPEIRSGAAPRT